MTARCAVRASVVYRWYRRARETGTVALEPHTGGGRPKINAAGAAVLVLARNDRTRAELAAR